MAKIDLAEKLTHIKDHWAPHIIATYNDNDVMVVKIQGEFVWHAHPETDDLFLVLTGEIDIEMRDFTITLGPGQMYVVPAGVEHRPVARQEAHLLLIEPKDTPNTGDPATAVHKPQL